VATQRGEALDIFREHSRRNVVFSAALAMDMQMPVMDGIEATQKIRLKESGTSGHMPIVAITANAFDHDRRKCFEAGMDGYVVKPISAKAIGDEVDRVMALFNHAQTETVQK
jgi:two-component system, sensor histidine kinase and response regulator